MKNLSSVSNVTFCNNLLQPNQHHQKTLDEIIGLIKQPSDDILNKIKIVRHAAKRGDKHQKNAAKRSLPILHFNGFFETEKSIKNDSYVPFSSCRVVLDIDDLTPERLYEIKELSKSKAFTETVFISPSGNGLKIVIRHGHQIGYFAHPLEKVKINNR